MLTARRPPPCRRSRRPGRPVRRSARQRISPPRHRPPSRWKTPRSVAYGAARPLPALVYGTVATAVGGAVSFFLAGGLLKGFSGSWLFDKGVVLDQRFYVAVLVGACGWVLLATRTGMPVSTTHAIIGALCGAGLVAYGNAMFQWTMLGQRFAVPLAVSPLLSMVTVYVLAWPVVFLVRRFAGRRAVAEPGQSGGPRTPAIAPRLGGRPAVERRRPWRKRRRRPPRRTTSRVAPVTVRMCGLISFARGWNDTPKIAALSLLALAGVDNGTAIGFVIVTVAMTAGGLVMGRKVLETLARKLTPLPLAESLTASLVTATLVGLASWVALPGSTTHVATGSIIGGGLKNNPGGVKWGKVGEIALSWVITLPVAAVIAAVAKFILR